jgi:hypothetical protein
MKNLNIYFLLKHQLFITIISISLWIYLLGPDFIHPTNQEWFNSGDLSTYQLGWKYFSTDIWRFPISLNPNYGIYVGGSLVFSDSIPIFAIFFKIFSNYLPSSFQYFSIWILLCIYLQLFFSYKIIFKITGDSFYSLIASLFFCFATIFIHRSALHLSLTGQWLILLAFYIEILETKYKSILRGSTILLSCTIHFYFTIILLIFNLIIQILSFFNKKNSLFKIIKQMGITYLSLFILMFFIGYFSIDAKDGLGGGYGYFNSNLNSFFNPVGVNNFNEFNWSFFFPKQKRLNGEYEGFAFLGISGLIFLFLFILNFKFKKYKIIFNNYEILIICIIFLLLSISNNINWGEKNLVTIPLNNIFYAMFSSIRASGRLIWPVYYLIFIYGIIFIHKYFKKKKSYFIIIFLFIIQIMDIHPGLLKYKFGNQYVATTDNNLIKDKIWSNLSSQFNEIRLIEPSNNSNIFKKMSKYLLSENFSKTDIFYLGRVNRKAIPFKKYELINIFNKKNLEIFDRKLFISDDINVVQNIYSLYENKLYYYFRDDLWLISNQIINNQKSKVDLILLSNHYEFDLKEKNEINVKNIKNFLGGMGWSKELDSEGLVADGYYSTIIFKATKNKCIKSGIINLTIERYFPHYKKPIKINLFLNKVKQKTILLNDDLHNEINLSFNCFLTDNFIIDFEIENPVSLYDLRKGLNRYKRSIIIKSISISG